MLRGNATAGAELGEAVRQTIKRHCPGRHRAAIDRALCFAERGPGEILQHATHAMLHRMRHRPMRAAAQDGGIESGFCQHTRDAGDMRGLPAMRSASEHQLFVAQAETFSSALHNERQSLQGLDRGTRKDSRRHIADGEHRLTFGIAYGNSAAVPGFDQRPADHFNQDRISHGQSSAFGGIKPNGSSWPDLFRPSTSFAWLETWMTATRAGMTIK